MKPFADFSKVSEKIIELREMANMSTVLPEVANFSPRCAMLQFNNGWTDVWVSRELHLPQ